MNAPKLKPCPFCGHPPYNDEQTAHVFGLRTGYDWAIACSNCEVSAPGAQTLSDAIAAWNTRATDPRLADAESMAEALRDMLHQLDMRDEETGEAIVEVSTMFNGAGKRWGGTVKSARAALEKWRAGK